MYEINFVHTLFRSVEQLLLFTVTIHSQCKFTVQIIHPEAVPPFTQQLDFLSKAVFLAEQVSSPFIFYIPH